MSPLLPWFPRSRALELGLAVLLVAVLLVGVERLSSTLTDETDQPAEAVRSDAVLPTVQDAFPPNPRTFHGPGYGLPGYSPTADKPQSKLWHHDGSWWALMVSAPSSAVHVFRLSEDLTVWRDTGTVVDARADSRGDAVVHGDVVYVASRGAGHIALAKLVYDRAQGAYEMERGFPLPVVSGATESVTATIDSLDRIWLTYQQSRRVHVLHSTATDREWTEPFAPGVDDQRLSADDLSTIVSVDGGVAVMWSDQASGAFRFAQHDDDDPDDVWQVETPLEGENVADDHISATVTEDGRVLAVVKTSNSDDVGAADQPGLILLVREPAGTWSSVPVTTAEQDWTRPILVVDRTNSEVLVLATSATRGGSILMHCSSLESIDFSAGRARPFVHPHDFVNNVTSAKDAVTADTDLVVLASTGGSAARYYYAVMRISDADPGPPDPALGASALVRRPCDPTT